jgi:hypothetical protein
MILTTRFSWRRPQFHPHSYLDVVDEDLPKAVGQHVLGRLGRAITNVGHLVHALEASAHSVVDTLGLPPVALELAIPVALVAGELLRSFLDNLRPRGRCDGHG